MLPLSSCVPGSIGTSRFEGSSCIRGWKGHRVLRKLSAVSYILVCRRRSVVYLIRTAWQPPCMQNVVSPYSRCHNHNVARTEHLPSNIHSKLSVERLLAIERIMTDRWNRDDLKSVTPTWGLSKLNRKFFLKHFQKGGSGLGEHDYLGGTSSEITNNVRVFGGPTLMIPSTLLLQYFHAAQCHLYDLLSSASSSYAASIDKECIDNDNNNDSKNNNLLSYHRNQIVHVQHVVW